jgi:hypothetical protein
MNIFSLFRKPSTIATSVSPPDLLQDTIDTNTALAAAGAASEGSSSSAPLPGGFQACALCAVVHQNCLSPLSASHCCTAASGATLSPLLSSPLLVHSSSSLIPSMPSPPSATPLYSSHSSCGSCGSCGGHGRHSGHSGCSRHSGHSRHSSCGGHSRHGGHTVDASGDAALASSPSSSAADNKDNVG